MNSIIRAASRLALNPIRERIFMTQTVGNNRFSINKRWAHNAPLTYDFARERIMLVLHLFDKIDPNRLTLDSRFVEDLGLDSLDHVEIIMHLEDEFKFEIPDKDAEKLLKPSDILKYITDKEEAYEELQHHHHHSDHGHGELGHGSNDSSHHHSPANNLNDHRPMIHQKRDLSSWSISKRYLSDEQYPTTFNADPPKTPKIEEIQERVMKVCSKYDKIDSSQLELVSHFVSDLGLDSLDHVEIMMELEDEFGLEIPDQDAEKLMRPVEIAKYIFDKEESRPVVPQDRPF